MSTYSRVAGTGSYLPEQRLSNQDLVERLAKIGLETSDEWIVTRSGISARHFAADNQLTSDLAVKAAEAALEAAGCTSEDLDLLRQII
jgi:3-oxoacyl-[acyl-carrier-protein] synthase-3